MGMRRMFNEKQIEKMILEAKKDVSTLVDSNGNVRFLEGDITAETISGITQTYGKWSLSGSHLLIVIALDLANSTVVAGSTKIADIEVPEWIYNKIVPILSTTYVGVSNTNAFASNLNTQAFNTRMNKENGLLTILKYGDITLNSDKAVRITYDLLID